MFIVKYLLPGKVKNALYFFLWLFSSKGACHATTEKSGQRQRKLFSFPRWFVFIVRETFHVLLLMKFKPGAEVPIFSGNSCIAGVPCSGGTFFEATCCLLKEN